MSKSITQDMKYRQFILLFLSVHFVWLSSYLRVRGYQYAGGTSCEIHQKEDKNVNKRATVAFSVGGLEFSCDGLHLAV